MNIIEARTEEHFDAVRRLLAAYIAEQGFSPNTSSIFRDLGDLPGRYAPPECRFLLAMSGDEPVGCIGLAKATEEIGELKRLYVSPARRGAGVGRAGGQGREQEGGEHASPVREGVITPGRSGIASR